MRLHAGIDASTKKTIIDHVMDQAPQGLSLVEGNSRHFVVSQDITAEEERMQASQPLLK
jgi:hypothetical protein